ncbi:disulfide bond formation protein DsbB [Duganella sp. CF402]|uniref:disulfide bond formation protein B n=1 Tax=unclassified Duganella TaxID=2636909 RepID=UPI0008B4186E|nr:MULTISPECIES: disulfide bond formation protein B [unclassified Duganella]RZT05727.1 thiol:disulfide interchange protein DsbB [Duganella sp. BK701]SEM93458.1 disulfide bond formation protein DsbB [Duganella sp. CF402]
MVNTRSLLLSIAVAAFGLIGVALYLQHGLDMLPCPLCVIQRYLFIAIGVCALIGAYSSKPKALATVGLLAAIGGLGTAGKHLWVLAHPGLSCGIDPMETFLNKIPTATYLPFLFKADGLCEDALAPWFGLSIPQWSFLWFGLFTLALGWALIRRAK